MTEQKVTLDDVLRAIDKLVAAGKAPNQSNVRTVLNCERNMVFDEYCSEVINERCADWLMKNMRPLTTEQEQKIKKLLKKLPGFS